MRSNLVWSIAIAAATALLTACSADAPALSGKTVASRCLNIDLPVETAVNVFGVNRGEPGPGERPLGFREHRPTRVHVETGQYKGPEVLILSSYEPVIWDVSAVAANDLRGIVAYGYYRPMVAGASGDLPVRIVALRNEAYQSNGADPVMRPNAADDSDRDDVAGHCGEPTWVSGPSREMAKMANNVEMGIGLPVTQVVGTHSASKLSLKHPPLPSVADLERAAAECDTMAEECFPHGQSFGAKGPVRPGMPGEAKQAPPMRTKWRDDPWSSDGG